MQQQSFCQAHQEPNVYVCWINNQLLEFCKICIHEKNSFILITEVQKNIDLSKTLMIENLKERENINKNILKTYIEALNTYKNQQAEKIQKLIETAEQSISNIDKFYTTYIQKIESFTQLDVELMKNLFQKSYQVNDLFEEKFQLQIQFLEMQLNSKQSSIYNILCDFPLNTQVDLSTTQKEKNIKSLLVPKCKKHNQDILGIDVASNLTLDQRYYCINCLSQNQYNARVFISLAEVQSLWNDSQANLKFAKDDYLDQLSVQTQKLIQQIFKNIQKYQKQSKDIIISLEKQKINFFNNFNKNPSFKQLRLDCTDQLQELINIYNFRQQCKGETKTNNDKQINQLIARISKLECLIQNQKVNKTLNCTFEFQVLKDSAIKFYENCLAISINWDNSILIAGGKKAVRVFQLKNEKLQELQNLQQNSEYVQCLQFFHNSNNFIAGSDDCTIKIFGQSQNINFSLLETLKGHQKAISCLLVNKSDDFAISGSLDYTIKIWNLKTYTEKQTLKFHKNSVYGLSLNDSEDKIISCGLENLIIVFQLKKNQEWIPYQTITVEQQGYRLCFITNELFVFQPYAQQHMIVFQINNKKKFQEISKIQSKNNSLIEYEGCYFPAQFVKSKSLLINKTRNLVKIYYLQENKIIEEKQSLEFKNWNIYGTISQDGKILVIFDQEMNQLQIWCYREIEQ